MKDLQTEPYQYPTRGFALDAVKLAAAFLMLLDHIDYMLLERSVGGLLLLGRGAFPLFAYATAAALLRTSPDKGYNYAWKIGLLAILVEPISQWTRDIDSLNVLFTLAGGALMIPLMMKLRSVMRHVVLLALIPTLYFPNIWEFGVIGLMLPTLIYMWMNKTPGAGSWLLIYLLLVNFGDAAVFMADLNTIVLLYMVAVALATVLCPLFILKLAQTFTESRRFLPKYFLHIFYPAHLIVLAVLASFV